MPTDDIKDDHRHANVRLNPNPSTPAAQYPLPPSHSNPRFLSLLLKAIIMALIISLFLLFLGVAAVALLHIFVASGALHRHRNRNRRRTTPFSDGAAASYSADLQKFLPRLKFTAGLAETTRDCVICLESFKEGEWCRSLPMCNHMFHENCVDTWLTKVPNCPICRSPVRFISEASASEISDDDCQLWWAVGV